MERSRGTCSIMKLTAKQIERLVKQGEVVHTECKDASGGLPDALWESYSSFANTDGGVILLGVKEVAHKLSIVGVPKAATLISFANPGTFRVNKAIVANTKATYRGLAAQLDFSKDTIGRAIATLIRLKIIRREGNKQTGHWEVVK